jgi:pilus assembly protein TadC
LLKFFLPSCIRISTIFGVTRHAEEYGGTLAFSFRSLVNQVRKVVRDAQAIIIIHKNYKLILLPMPSYGILAGLVIQHSLNAEGSPSQEY